jgi:HK97 family phage major capsid protein
MNPKELREKSVKLLRDAQAILLKPTVTAEARATFDKMISDADALEADAVRMDAINAKLEKYERGNPPPREQPGAGNADLTEQTIEVNGISKKTRNLKFERFIRYGEHYKETRDTRVIVESRDLGTTAAVGAGAQFIPQAFYPVLTEAMKAWGNVIGTVDVRETDDGAPMKMAFLNDTAALAHVVGETGPVVETDPLLSSLLLSTDQLVTDFIKISLAELQDSAFDLDKFVRDQFGKRYFRGLTSLITNGSSTGNIGSIVSGAYDGITSLYSNAIDYTDIVGLFATLDPAYIDNASWMMKSTTRGTLLGVKDTLGRPLYVPNPGVDGFDRLLGRPIVLNQYLDFVAPSGASPASNNVPIQFGDFKQGYLLRNVKPGLAIARLNERFMDTLEVGFLGYFRSGGVVTDAGTHPIVNLTMNTTGTAPAADN